MDYKQAIQNARKVGAAHAKGDALLAQTVFSASFPHAVDAEMIYNGAKKLGKTPKEIVELAAHNPVGFGNLQFV